jgi:hypothetical protein
VLWSLLAGVASAILKLPAFRHVPFGDLHLGFDDWQGPGLHDDPRGNGLLPIYQAGPSWALP